MNTYPTCEQILSECSICGRENSKRDEYDHCYKKGRTLGQAIAHARGAKYEPQPGRWYA